MQVQIVKYLKVVLVSQKLKIEKEKKKTERKKSLVFFFLLTSEVLQIFYILHRDG